MQHEFTQQRLKELLEYDPLTGIFIRLARTSERGASRIGDIAGTIDHGYIRISMFGYKYYAHTLAWVYMTGKWPEDQIDHWDGNGLNNKWENLRPANDYLNIANSIRENHGVEPHGAKFRARIKVDGIRYELGSFTDREQAEIAYKEALVKIYGEYAVYNRP